MKKKGTELKDLTVVELQDKLQEERTIADQAALQPYGKPDRKPDATAPKRKEVARILTELRKRELANTAKK
jgi:ribosomal protein L29